MPTYQIETPHGLLEIDHEGDVAGLQDAVNGWVENKSREKFSQAVANEGPIVPPIKLPDTSPTAPAFNLPRPSLETAGRIAAVANPLFPLLTQVLGKKTTNVIAKGGIDAAESAVEFATSPVGLGMATGSGAPKALQKAVSLGFLLKSAYDNPKLVQEVIDAPDDESRATALSNVFQNLTVAGGTALHLAGKPAVAPLTQEAVKAELQKMDPKTVQEPKPKTSDDVLDALHVSQDAWSKDFTALSPEQQQVHQQAIDEIDAGLLGFDKTQVNESRVRTRSPAAQTPPIAPAGAGGTAPGPSGEGGRASAFTQALREQGAPLTAEALSSPPAVEPLASGQPEPPIAEAERTPAPEAAPAVEGAAAKPIEKGSVVRSKTYAGEGDITILGPAETDANGRVTYEAHFGNSKRVGRIAAKDIGATQAAKAKPSPIAGPAMLDSTGEPVAKGEIGQTHADLIKDAVATGNVDAITGEHGFHDEAGKPLTRVEAADRALATGQIDQATHDRVMNGDGLHSEDLIPKEEEALPKHLKTAERNGKWFVQDKYGQVSGRGDTEAGAVRNYQENTVPALRANRAITRQQAIEKKVRQVDPGRCFKLAGDDAAQGNGEMAVGVVGTEGDKPIWHAVTYDPKRNMVYDGTLGEVFPLDEYSKLVGGFKIVKRLTGEEVDAFGQKSGKYPNQTTLGLGDAKDHIETKGGDSVEKENAQKETEKVKPEPAAVPSGEQVSPTVVEPKKSYVETQIEAGRRLLPFGETAINDPDGAFASGSKDYHENSMAFSALSRAVGVRKALDMSSGKEPYPTREQFEKGLENSFYHDALELRNKVLNELRSIGVDPKKTNLPNFDDFKTAKEFYEAMADADSRMRKSGASLASAMGFKVPKEGETKTAQSESQPALPEPIPDPQAAKMAEGLKKLGNVSRDPAATIEDELGRYSDEERAQLQKHLGTPDAEPETLAQAIAGKSKIPETKTSSTYVDEPSAEARPDSPEAEALKDWTSATEDSRPTKMKRGAGEAGSIPIPKPVVDVVRAASDAVTKPRKMSELDQATVERSAKQQKSFDEAQRATKEIVKVIPSLRRRNAASVWLEADGDTGKLAAWGAGAKGDMFKQAAKDAQTLTPEEIAITRKVKGAFDILGRRGQKHEVINSFRDNYIPHVVDLEKGTGLGGGGKLQQNFKFAKARTHNTFADLDAAGFKLKTLDIAKLLPAYLTEMNKVIADRQFVADIAERTAADGRPLVVARGRVGASVSPEGDYAYLVNPDASAGLKDAEGNPVDTSDYRVMENQPALHDWNFKKSDLEGNPIFMKDDLAVHPDAYKRIHAMLGRSALKDIPLVKAYDKLQSVMKREMFSLLAPFHQVQEGTHGIAHRVSPVSGLEQVDMRKPEMYDAARHGLMLLPDRSTSAGYMEGLGGKGTFLTKTLRWLGEKSDASGKAELAGKGATALADVVDGYQNYLFHQYIPAMKFKTYQAALERNMSTYSSELKSGKMSEADVKLTTAEQVNAAYGHLNRALLDRNPTAQHLMEMTLLAPDFLEARARFVGQAAKGAVGAKVGREQFKALAFMALVQAGSAYAISQLTGNKYDPKKPFSVVTKDREYSLRSVPEDMLRLGTDVKALATGGDRGVPFISARVNPLLASMEEFLSGKNYRGEKTNVKETAEELLAKYIPITARAIPAVRNLTETSWNNPVSPLEQLAGSLGLKISRVSPITETYSNASQWMEKQGIPKDKGSYPVSKYQRLRYALEDGDLDRASNELARLKKSADAKSIAKGFRESVLHNFTKSREMDQQFRNSLNDSDKAVFDLAVGKRQGILDKFNAIPDSGLPYVSSQSGSEPTKRKRR